MLNYEDVLCVICARGGSKGLVRKNIRSLDGKPLVARPILDAQKSGAIGTIVVSTDDTEIAKIALAYGAEVPFIRPVDLSGDLVTTEDTLKHALLETERLMGKKFNICVFITPTDVFRSPSNIKDVVDALIKDESLDSAFMGAPTHKNFWEQQSDGSWIRMREWMSKYSSRQVRQSIVREDTGIACASKSALWRDGRRIGDNVKIFINEDPFSHVDIHTIEDLHLAETVIAMRRKEEKSK
jgi:CMP-N,N'-diacetyllegionaminic acid synthase|tara:strand:- start:13910 stop:14629 length:720 start_codon:yes stop_codon:yes gene_type:complete